MQPLEGLRVLDFGHYLSGPLAGVFLADQGADVISITRPNTRAWNHDAQRVLSRGKRGREVDLKTPHGMSEVLELASLCDVVIENFRPGVMTRLGLGYEQVRALNAKVVYVSLPAYSRHDPRAKLRAYDSTISASCGLFTDLSLAGSALNLPPTYTALPIPSVYAGLWGAIAAVSSIYGLLQGGAGDHLEVPLMDAAMSSAAGVLNTTRRQPARYNVPPVSRRLLDPLSLQHVPPSVANLVHRVVWNSMPATFRNYRCKDGRYLFLCVTDNSNQIKKLLDVTNLRSISERIGLHEGSVIDAPPSTNNLNAFRGTSRKWRRFSQALARCFGTEDAAVWAERLSTAGVPAGVQQTTSEWASMPAMFESGVLFRAESSARSTVAPGPQIDVRGDRVQTATIPKRATAAPAPCPWMSERRFVESRQGTGKVSAGTPLCGVRVVDLSNVIAGPCAARVLAELGGDVIHVSPATPKMGPRQTMLFGLDVNQGKRDIAIDLHSAEGRSCLERMLQRADIVIVNKTPEQARRLGVAPDQIHSSNPRAIATALTAYGGVVPGGWEGRPGYDPILQAVGGIMRRFGGDEHPQLHGMASCIDYFTGFSAAFASIVALIARERGSIHLEARTSLARTTGWIQLPFLNGQESSHRQSGMNAKGAHPLDRIYRARDGWIHIHGDPLTGALARSTDVEHWIATETRQRRMADAVAWAAQHGLTGQPVISAAAFRKLAVPVGPEAEQLATEQPSGRLIQVQHPSGEVYVVPDALWLRSSNGRLRVRPAPSPGQNTREILRDLGYTARQIQRLIDNGIAAERHFTGHRFLPE